MPQGLNEVFDAVVDIGTHAVTTYLGDAVGNYRRSILLEAGFEWEVVDFRIVAATNYTAATDFYKFYLKDSDNNIIATVAETLGVNPATGLDDAPVAAYKSIDCKSAADYLYVVPVQSGVGLAMIGVRAIVRLKQKRAA